jgi:hypothetical protein
MRYSFLFCLLVSIFASYSSAQADVSSYQRRSDMSFGIELNFLWLAPPFKSIELKAWTKISDTVDFVFGYGGQFWNLDESKNVNAGSMNSHALILGVRGFLFHTDTVLEYDTWLAYDRLKQKDGKEYSGFSQSNEFFGGYQFFYGGSNTYSIAGMNLGFWGYKGYDAPIDDRFVPTILPKFIVGEGLK